ncbi:MAG: N-acetyltransferase family protein [Pseudomonadales bacterium]
MTNPEILIRDARADDVDVLVTFQRAMAAETEDKGLDPARLRRGVQHLIGHPAEGFYLVAERNGAAVGSLMVTYEWSDWRNGRFWWIQSVYVSADARRQGVYSALHAAVRARAKGDPESCGIRLYVEQDNTVAQQTYRALGMVQTHYRLFEEEFQPAQG